MLYKNTSYSAKTFYGVTFQPGETKEVSDYINNKYMILVEDAIQHTTKIQQKPSPEKPKKSSEKSEEAVPQVVDLPDEITEEEVAEEAEAKPAKSDNKKEHKS